jgi:hypothetical protein
MGFSITTPGASAQLSQLNVNTDGLEALLTLIQTQTDELEVPIANMDLNLTSIETLTQSLEALQTEIRNQLQIAGSSGNITVSQLSESILGNLNLALDELLNIKTQIADNGQLLFRLAGESTVVAALSDPHFPLTNTAITQLPTYIANAAILVGIKADGTVNSADIRYGYNSTNLRFTLSPGGSASIDAPQGKKIDTAGVWVQGATGDGIVIGLMN